MVTTNTLHEFFVEFTNQSKRKRELSKPFDTVFESHHIIADFLQIFGAPLNMGAGFGCQ